jgi:hypothetical protein
MDDWYYEADGERRGPYTLAKMRELVELGAIRRYTRVTPPGAAQAADAGSCTELIIAPQREPAILFAPGYSRPAMVSLILGLLSIVPFVGYAGLVVTGFAIRDLRRHRELKGDARTVAGGLLALFFSIIWTWVFFS